MSALWADSATTDDALGTDVRDRPALRGLPRLAPRLARVPFLLVLIAVVGAGMTGLLMLNTSLQNQAFQVSTLHRQARELAHTQADLENQLDQRAAPQELARRASALGLRPNPYPAFVTLPSGKVQGRPRPVSGAEVPTLIIKTPAELAAERAAAAARAKAEAERRAAEAHIAKVKAAKAKAAKAAKAKTKAKTKTTEPTPGRG